MGLGSTSIVLIYIFDDLGTDSTDKIQGHNVVWGRCRDQPSFPLSSSPIVVNVLLFLAPSSLISLHVLSSCMSSSYDHNQISLQFSYIVHILPLINYYIYIYILMVEVKSLLDLLIYPEMKVWESV